MRAARIHAYGHSDQVHIEEAPQPTPSSTEVLVKTRAAGINPVDWKIREGFMAKVTPRQFPFTLGQDFCGEVIAVGERAGGVTVGDVVYGFANGTYAEYVVAAPAMFAPRPRTLDDATAAALPTPGATALQMVNRHVDPKPGKTVLIHGAAGAVGSIATQLCVAGGARVVANASSKDHEYLVSLGVAQVIDYRTERFDDTLRGVDAVIDTVGNDTFARSIEVVREGGVIVTTVASIDAAAGRPVRAVRFLMQRNRADLEELARLIDEGTVRPRDIRAVPLDEAPRAQDLNQHHQSSDKIVVRFA